MCVKATKWAKSARQLGYLNKLLDVFLTIRDREEYVKDASHKHRARVGACKKHNRSG
jgi:hypothetical protein